MYAAFVKVISEAQTIHSTSSGYRRPEIGFTSALNLRESLKSSTAVEKFIVGSLFWGWDAVSVLLQSLTLNCNTRCKNNLLSSSEYIYYLEKLPYRKLTELVSKLNEVKKEKGAMSVCAILLCLYVQQSSETIKAFGRRSRTAVACCL
jgi:surface polysaccharide O-acyltransferase-like enzyme